MVGGLFEIELGAILSLHLESLTQDGVQRLIKDLLVHLVAETLSNHELHSFDWVIQRIGIVEINWHSSLKLDHCLKGRLVVHALNWETNPSQIEVSIEDLLSCFLSHKPT